MLELFSKVQILKWEVSSSLERDAGDGDSWVKFNRSEGSLLETMGVCVREIPKSSTCFRKAQPVHSPK